MHNDRSPIKLLAAVPMLAFLHISNYNDFYIHVSNTSLKKYNKLLIYLILLNMIFIFNIFFPFAPVALHALNINICVSLIRSFLSVNYRLFLFIYNHLWISIEIFIKLLSTSQTWPYHRLVPYEYGIILPRYMLYSYVAAIIKNMYGIIKIHARAYIQMQNERKNFLIKFQSKQHEH